MLCLYVLMISNINLMMANLMMARRTKACAKYSYINVSNNPPDLFYKLLHSNVIYMRTENTYKHDTRSRVKFIFSNHDCNRDSHRCSRRERTAASRHCRISSCQRSLIDFAGSGLGHV